MHTYVLFVITFLLLTACTPNKPAKDQSKSTRTISVEQQERDASVKLEAENVLLEGAQHQNNEAENTITQHAQLKSEKDQQLLLDTAELEKEKAEQDLLQRAKIEAEKKQAILDQAANANTDLPNSTL